MLFLSFYCNLVTMSNGKMVSMMKPTMRIFCLKGLFVALVYNQTVNSREVRGNANCILVIES